MRSFLRQETVARFLSRSLSKAIARSLRPQNDRHPGMYLGDQLICFTSDDDAGPQPLFGIGILPTIPESSETKVEPSFMSIE